MNEEITAFNSNSVDEFPFFIQMTGISYCDGTYRIDRENSELYVFEFIIKGKGTVTINNETFTAEEGDIYILPKGSKHNYFSDQDDPWIKIWFNINGTLIDMLMQVYKLNTVHHVKGLDLRYMFERFLETAKSQGKPVNEIFNESAIIFHEMLLRISSAVNKQKPLLSKEALMIREYLDRHIEEKVSIRELGGMIFRSASQTIRIFKKETGYTPYDYLLIKRMEMAKLLILNTNLQVREIAFKLCFTDEHYFSNFFKEKTGMTPLEYKRGAGKKTY